MRYHYVKQSTCGRLAEICQSNLYSVVEYYHFQMLTHGFSNMPT